MAVVITDILQLTLSGTSLGEPTTNVFFYECEASSASPTPYADFVDEFVSDVIPALVAVLNTNTRFVEIEVRNVSNNIDFYVRTGNWVGTLAGAASPPHLTFTAQLVRSNLTTRNGSKRFSGLIEEGLTGTTINWVAGQKLALEVALAAELQPPGVPGAEYGPVIVGRVSNPPVGGPYLDLTRINPIAQARLGLLTSSQVSRKIRQAY